MSDLSQPIAYILDDEQHTTSLLQHALGELPIESMCFATLASLLSASRNQRPQCIVTEHNLSDGTGLQLQQELQNRGDTTPIVVLTSAATVAVAVAYMQAGAVTVLEKPAQPSDIVAAIKQALVQDAKCYELQQRLKALRSSQSELTAQEKRVMESVIGGKLNKVIAGDLDVSVRTVEKIRARILRKFRCENATELAARATELQVLTERVIPLGARALDTCFEPRC
ncbi:Response regulator protein TodT [Posidoniimonas polymericola]|uniref:Response regulator protein TodT n=1 Tax=Posidoniimonas polymericola TaxID=2528002 RepID=A0A5C5YM96_9BACT|nr:response regulator [Posidoniimonas polymericola]TWT75878.1 Response regulator protein TodT [Posidoniimonas polymericola]